MSAISSPSQAISIADGDDSSPVSALAIDRSCRAPVLLLFLGALVWLLISSGLGMVASLKFHAPGLLADCPWFTYGRVHPAHLNALIYGFAAQAGLGVILWLVAHLGRARLALFPGIIAGVLVWNLGVLLGIVGILYGESTGFEWLEMPRYASAALFCGYLLIGLGALLTLRQRREREFYISQWFILAALFWFPWIFSTANLLLVVKPARGVLQTAIDCWYVNNLKTVWFGFLGLAAVFYYIPKISKHALHSHYLGIFTFWLLAVFGSWGGIPAGTPLPSWMSAMSTVGALLTVVPILAVAINVWGTLSGDYSKLRESRPFKFFLFGVIAYVIAGLAGAATSLFRFGKITQFTWYVPAQTQLFLYGFFAMTMFGAMYYIVPRLVRTEFPAPGLICGHFACATFGLLFYALPLAVGGILQGLALNDPARSFADVTQSTLLFLRISTLGDLLMALGNLLMVLNFAGLLARVARASATAAWAANVKTVEAPL